MPSESDESAAAGAKRRYHPHHVVRPTSQSLEACLALSDVVISAVPSASYKVKTEWLKDGCVCVNVASEKNFEKDVREKVRPRWLIFVYLELRRDNSLFSRLSGVYIPPRGREGDHLDATS